MREHTDTNVFVLFQVRGFLFSLNIYVPSLYIQKVVLQLQFLRKVWLFLVTADKTTLVQPLFGLKNHLSILVTHSEDCLVESKPVSSSMWFPLIVNESKSSRSEAGQENHNEKDLLLYCSTLSAILHLPYLSCLTLSKLSHEI